jgi:leader peptidase (prepilin peptidase)/N-methyltransferase
VLILASILFGLIFGSFIGSTVYRLANDKSLLTPRSYCPHCYRTILWYYNIPFFSYIWLKAKTKCCHSSISIFYPFIEVSTVIIFSINIFLFQNTDLILIFFLSIILIIIFFTDYYYFLIHDVLVAIFLLFTIVAIFYFQFNPFNVSFISSVLCSLISMFIIWSIGRIHLFLRKTEGLGLGDVKLIGVISLWTGFAYLPILIISSSIFAISHILMISKLFNQKEKFIAVKSPFGSYLSLTLLLLIYLSQW